MREHAGQQTCLPLGACTRVARRARRLAAERCARAASRGRLGRRLSRDDRAAPDRAGGRSPARSPARFPDRAAASTARRSTRSSRELDTVVMPGIVHWGHPAFLGYFGSTSTVPRCSARSLAAALNVSAMTWRTSPAATELETVVLGWIREMVGLPRVVHGRRVRHGVGRRCCTRWPRRASAAATDVRAARDRRTRGRAESIASTRPIRRTARIEKAMIVLGLGEAERRARAERRRVPAGRRGARARDRRRIAARAFGRWRWSRRSGRRRRRASIRCREIAAVCRSARRVAARRRRVWRRAGDAARADAG